MEISLQQAFGSIVFSRKITDEYIWTGTIDSDLVDEFLVEDDYKREELKKLIKELEKAVINYRSGNFPNALASLEEYNHIQKLSKQIFTIVVSPGVDVVLYLVNLIKKFDMIKNKSPEEFAAISSACKLEIDQNRKKILTYNSVPAYSVYYPEKNEYGFATVTIKEQESRIKKKGNLEKLFAFIRLVYGNDNLSVENELPVLDDICDKLLIPDLLESLNSSVVKSLLYQTFLRNYLLKSGMPKEEIEELSPEELKEATDKMYLPDEREAYKQAMSDTLITHIEYFSMEKFILAYMQRSIEDYNRSAQLSFDFRDLFEESRGLDNLLKRIIESGIVSNAANVNIPSMRGEKKVSLKTLRAIQKEFIDGVYITPDIERVIKEMLYLNNSNLGECNDEMIMKFNLSRFDYEIISLSNFANLKRLYELGKIDKLFIDRLVRNCSLDVYTSLKEKNSDDLADPISRVEFPSKMELITFLFNNGLITSKDLYEYYLLNEITLSELEQLESLAKGQIEFSVQMKEQISDYEFLSKYKEFVQARLQYEDALKNEDPDIDRYKANLEIKRNEKDRLLMLYRKYKLSNLSIEEEKEFVGETLTYYCIENADNIVEESLREMYKDSVVSLENIKELDTEYLQIIVIDSIFARGELNLEDTEKIKSSLSPDALKDLIKHIVKNPSITRSQKFALIMNVYGNENDIGTAEELLKDLKLYYAKKDLETTSTKVKKVKKKTVIPSADKSQTTNTNTHNNGTEWVYPKFVKWEFLRALDKEAEITLYAGGYVEIYSKKLDSRIIERFFESDEEGDDFGIDAYGHATFVLSDGKYRQNVGQLIGQRVCKIKDGTSASAKTVVEDIIIRSVLSSLVPSKDRIIHNTKSPSKNWMRAVAKYFDIDLETDIKLVKDSRYTKEELEQLRDVIKRFENAYVDRNAVR